MSAPCCCCSNCPLLLQSHCPRGSSGGWVGPSPFPWSLLPSLVSNWGEQQCTWLVQHGSSLRLRYCLLPEHQICFPCCLSLACESGRGDTWLGELYEGGAAKMSSLHTYTPWGLCLQGQWPEGCWCPAPEGYGWIWRNPSSADMNEMKVQRGLGYMRWGGGTVSCPWETNAEVHLLCALAQLTGGIATTLVFVAMWREGFPHKNR